MLCSGVSLKSENEKLDYESKFANVPPPFSQDERDEWLAQLTGVVVSSDAFFPFVDNVRD